MATLKLGNEGYDTNGTNGKVGVNKTSCVSKLHVKQSDTGYDDGIRLESSAYTDRYLDIWSTTAQGLTATNDLHLRTTSTSEIRLQTNGNNTRFTAKSDGKIGVGTTEPDSQVHIFNDESDPVLHLENDKSPYPEAILKVTAGAGNGGITTCSNPGGTRTKIGTYSNHNLYFITNNTEKITVESGGDVGIGVLYPDEKLDIDGAICIKDGMSAPQTHAGKASIYVDSADGNLKIKFGNGTVKTIVTD